MAPYKKLAVETSKQLKKSTKPRPKNLLSSNNQSMRNSIFKHCVKLDPKPNPPIDKTRRNFIANSLKYSSDESASEEDTHTFNPTPSTSQISTVVDLNPIPSSVETDGTSASCASCSISEQRISELEANLELCKQQQKQLNAKLDLANKDRDTWNEKYKKLSSVHIDLLQVMRDHQIKTNSMQMKLDAIKHSSHANAQTVQEIEEVQFNVVVVEVIVFFNYSNRYLITSL